jgi:NADH-quinone oxidoreductase subunit C
MTECLDHTKLATVIRNNIDDSVCRESVGDLVVELVKLRDVLSFLQNEETHDFQLLNSITAVDYIEFFQLVYHLTSLRHNHSVIIKANIFDRFDPIAPSVIDIWRGADYQEREIYDLMGIKFKNHPNLKRLLLWEGFEGHPLRRDYLEPPMPYNWPQGG